MKEPENPFTFRSSESIESRSTFLKLFGYTILDALPDDCFLRKVTIFRSSPGGGKTSLFRIFSPESLVEISRDTTTYKDLFGTLNKHKAIGDTAPNILGVYLRLYDYAAIQDPDLDQEQNNQYLFSLIGIRLIMKALTGILTLKGLNLEHLHRITVQKPPDHCIAGISLPCDGQKLYRWASEMERNICGVINRFDTNGRHPAYFNNIIDYLHIIDHNNLLFDGKPIVSGVLILLDDIHELTGLQRKGFLDKIVNARLPIPIWIAERLESLEIDELPLNYGRDSTVVSLEKHWEKGNKFEKFAWLVSDKRTKHTSLDFDIDLYHHLESSVTTKSIRTAVNKIKQRIKRQARNKRTYKKWIEKEEQSNKCDYEGAVSWRMLEIKIAREESNAQTKLVDEPLEVGQGDPGLKAAAIFFIHKEFDIPYFFGFSHISKMATFNIEVFLKMAAALFDEIVSQRIRDRNDEMLDAARQEKIIKEIADDYFDQIPRVGRNGQDVVTFLSAFQKLANEETMKPNAPYVPGVTGIGIFQKHYDAMMNSYPKAENQNYDRLVEVLRSCIIHNYMSVKYDAKQGKPGNKVVLLYLNRLLCAHFDLPLGKGGWRPKTPDELCAWWDQSVTDTGDKEST